MRRGLVYKIIDVTSEMLAVLDKVGSYMVVVEDDIKEMYINVFWRDVLETPRFAAWECENILRRLLIRYTGADSWYGIEKRCCYKLPMFKLYMDDNVYRIFFTSVWDVAGNFFATFNGYGDVRELSGMGYMEFDFKRRVAYELSELRTKRPDFTGNETEVMCEKYSMADGVNRLIDLFCKVCLLKGEDGKLKKYCGEQYMQLFENEIERMERCRIKH